MLVQFILRDQHEIPVRLVNIAPERKHPEEVVLRVTVQRFESYKHILRLHSLPVLKDAGAVPPQPRPPVSVPTTEPTRVLVISIR